MKKKRIAVFCFLCLLLVGCNGNNNGRKEGKQENPNVDYANKILLVLSDTSYANGYENKGYFVLGDGSKCFFDLSEEEREYASIENLYHYLSNHLSEFERKEYLSPDKAEQCVKLLQEVEKNSEIKKEENVIFDAEQRDLYGVRYTSATPEFVALKGTGCQSWERSDKDAEKLIHLLGEEWADSSDYSRRRRKALEYEFFGDEVVAMFVQSDITGEKDSESAVLLVFADGSVEAGFGDYSAILNESGLTRQDLERYLIGQSKLGSLGADDEKLLLNLICSVDTESVTEGVEQPFGEPQIVPTREYYRFCVQWNEEGATYVQVNRGDDQKGNTSQLKDKAAKRAVELVAAGEYMEAWYDMLY